jgi:acyl-CoA synthetase (AMP-forming)/AMP-acid ligase II
MRSISQRCRCSTSVVAAGRLQACMRVALRELDPAGLIQNEKVTHGFVVPAACVEKFKPCKFWQAYGLTETTGAVFNLPPEDHDPNGPNKHRLRSCGVAGPGVEARIVGDGDEDVAVIGVPHEKWGETGKAVVVAAEGVTADDATAAAIIAFAKTQLAGFRCPTTVDWVTELPRNPTGKILKKDLREPYWVGRERRVGNRLLPLRWFATGLASQASAVTRGASIVRL